MKVVDDYGHFPTYCVFACVCVCVCACVCVCFELVNTIEFDMGVYLLM